MERATPTPQKTGAVPQTPDSSAELDWMRSNYDGMLTQMEQMRRQLEEYETSAMSDEEKTKYDLNRQRQELTAQQQRLAEVQYAQDLHRYYSQFVPLDNIKGRNPTEWQHSVLSALSEQNKRLAAEVAALKKASQPGQGAPKVGTGAGVPVHGKKSVFEMSPEERKALHQRALAGLATPEDYPAVPQSK